MNYPLDMKRILVSFLLALGLIVSVAPPALAADIQPPVLLDWKLLDRKADISNGNAIVRVEFSISDDSEINSPLLIVGSKTTSQTSGFGNSKLMSKVGKTSTYQAAATIGFGKAPGEWSWSLFPLGDVLGNSGGFGPGGTWPNIIMVYDKDFTEAKQLAQLKAKQEAEEKVAADLKAKQEAEEKAAAEKAAAEKVAADLKAKQEDDEKALEDTSLRLKSELNSESSKLSKLIDELLKTASSGSSKN
jgi:hypothetical protein